MAKTSKKGKPSTGTGTGTGVRCTGYAPAHKINMKSKIYAAGNRCSAPVHNLCPPFPPGVLQLLPLSPESVSDCSSSLEMPNSVCLPFAYTRNTLAHTHSQARTHAQLFMYDVTLRQSEYLNRHDAAVDWWKKLPNFPAVHEGRHAKISMKMSYTSILPQPKIKKTHTHTHT